MYGHALKMFRPFTIPHRRMPEGVSIPTEAFLQFMVTFRGRLAKVRACTENVSVIYHSLPRHARYPYPPKLSRKFMVTFRGRPAKVSACTENISEIYHCLPTDVQRCIHTHQNHFGNLPCPSDACHQRYGHAQKMFR
jgi:hypothetical protein